MTWSSEIRSSLRLPPELERLLEVAEDAEARWLSIKAELDATPTYLVQGQAGVPKANPLISAERLARDACRRRVKT